MSGGLVTQVEGVLFDPGLVAMFNERVSIPEMTWARESEFAMQVLTRNEFTMKMALSNRQSLRDAIVNVASLGTTLDPSQKFAYLVPRDKGIMLDISYMGLANLAMESGSVRMVKAELVHESDTFILHGTDKDPTHKRDPFLKANERGLVKGVYCVAKTAHGDFITDTMSIDDVFRIRDRTESWKAHIRKGTKTPWATDTDEMVKKTIVKRAYKMWPRSKRLDSAIHYLNTRTEESIVDINGESKVHTDFQVDVAIEEIRNAPDRDRLRSARRHWQKIASENNDRHAYDRIKAVADRRLNQLSGNASNNIQDVEPNR